MGNTISAFPNLSVGECGATDVLPASAPTRRSCIVVKTAGPVPMVEVRKLLRLFRVCQDGTVDTLLFVHTLLSIPMLMSMVGFGHGGFFI